MPIHPANSTSRATRAHTRRLRRIARGQLRRRWWRGRRRWLRWRRWWHSATGGRAAGVHDTDRRARDASDAVHRRLPAVACRCSRVYGCRGGAAPRHRPVEFEPPRRRVAAGSPVGRRCARARDLGLGRRRRQLEPAAARALHAMRRRRVCASLRPLGGDHPDVGHADRYRVHGCRECGRRAQRRAGEPLGRWRQYVGRGGAAHRRRWHALLQRQGKPDRRFDRPALRIRGLGSARRERARHHAARALHERRGELGAGGADLRSGRRAPDHRQRGAHRRPMAPSTCFSPSWALPQAIRP